MRSFELNQDHVFLFGMICLCTKKEEKSLTISTLFGLEKITFLVDFDKC